MKIKFGQYYIKSIDISTYELTVGNYNEAHEYDKEEANQLMKLMCITEYEVVE